MPTYTGSTREQAIIKAVMGTCRPCCPGAGSGSTRTSRMLLCGGGQCATITIPNDVLTLSINEISGGLPTGDFELTWQVDQVVAQDLDQSEVPCLEINVTTSTGYITDLIFWKTELDCDYYIRYAYDPCTGFLSVVERSCNGDCPGQFPFVLNTLTQLTVVDCDPYFADLDDSPTFVGSVSV